MIRAGEYGELAAFAVVAEERSFRRAAARLNLKPSTLSHSVRALEERLGVRLLARTTRIVAVTAAGEALLAQVAPLLAALEAATETVNLHRSRPRGRVRLTMPQSAVAGVLGPKLEAFARDYPDVVLDVSVDDRLVDIVREGYDAGIRSGENVAAGMTAVRISPEVRAAVVASPAYWAHHPPPTSPRDLIAHRCLGRRYGAQGALYRWRFGQEAEQMEVTVTGPLVTDSAVLMRDAALRGVGIAMLAEHDVAEDIAAGRLLRVLEDWCPLLFAYYLYHPSRALASASLRALIDALATR